MFLLRARELLEGSKVNSLTKRSLQRLFNAFGYKVQRLPDHYNNREVFPISKIKEEYQQQIKEFQEKTRAMGYQDLENYYWYHTVDLGNGLITPGDYDYRTVLAQFKFPADMTGMSVLDVGSATGFFAFEFEKRGANVTSVELPSIADWDMPSDEDREQTLKELMAVHKANSVEDLHWLHLEGPFQFCRKLLNSNVRRFHSSIYELSLEKLGCKPFDLVFAGDILLHTFSPLKALVSLAPLCKGTLVLTQNSLDLQYDDPVMVYMGGSDRTADSRSWWSASRMCSEQILKRLGFKTVSVAGQHSGVLRPAGCVYTRDIIHATK
jgi:hypothetical protein